MSGWHLTACRPHCRPACMSATAAVPIEAPGCPAEHAAGGGGVCAVCKQAADVWHMAGERCCMSPADLGVGFQHICGVAGVFPVLVQHNHTSCPKNPCLCSLQHCRFDCANTPLGYTLHNRRYIHQQHRRRSSRPATSMQHHVEIDLHTDLQYSTVTVIGSAS